MGRCRRRSSICIGLDGGLGRMQTYLMLQVLLDRIDVEFVLARLTKGNGLVVLGIPQCGI